MAGPNAPLIPRGAARLCLWHVGLPQPTIFVVREEDALRARHDFEQKAPLVRFASFPDNSGCRSDSSFQVASLRGVTVELPTIQLAGVPNG